MGHQGRERASMSSGRDPQERVSSDPSTRCGAAKFLTYMSPQRSLGVSAPYSLLPTAYFPPRMTLASTATAPFSSAKTITGLMSIS